MILTPELKDELVEWLKEAITVDVETRSQYTGGLNGTDLYVNTHILKISIEQELIAEVYLD